MTVYFFLLQRDEATKQCRELSQELVNLRGELGKFGHLGLTLAVIAVFITKVHIQMLRHLAPFLFGFSVYILGHVCI